MSPCSSLCTVPPNTARPSARACAYRALRVALALGSRAARGAAAPTPAECFCLGQSCAPPARCPHARCGAPRGLVATATHTHAPPGVSFATGWAPAARIARHAPSHAAQSARSAASRRGSSPRSRCSAAQTKSSRLWPAMGRPPASRAGARRACHPPAAQARLTAAWIYSLDIAFPAGVQLARLVRVLRVEGAASLALDFGV